MPGPASAGAGAGVAGRGAGAGAGVALGALVAAFEEGAALAMPGREVGRRSKSGARDEHPAGLGDRQRRLGGGEARDRGRRRRGPKYEDDERAERDRGGEDDAPGDPQGLALADAEVAGDDVEEQAVADVYARCYEVLPEGGVLMNGDFIKPDGTSWTYEPGQFEVGRHLELLGQAGFKEPAFLALFEHNLDHPTAAQNYACLIAVK